MAVTIAILGTLLMVIGGIRLFFSILGNSMNQLLLSCLIAGIGLGATIMAYNI